MNKISIVLLLVLFYACSPDKEKLADGIERIPVDVHTITPDASSFIEKIEIVPLATNDSSLFSHYSKVMYNKEMDIYAAYTSNQTVFTFSGDGTFIGNSKKMQGRGPNEYYMAIDMQFNPYWKGIDLLGPSGTVYTYSPKFDFLSKRSIKMEFPVNYLMALSEEDYIFTFPDVWAGSEVSFANMKTQQIKNDTYSGFISHNSMSGECFYKVGNAFYYIPMGFSYYFYRIDVKEKKLIPMMYLDFGDSKIEENSLPGLATGKRVDSNEERSKLADLVQKRSKFVRESNYIVPYLKLFNDDYVYVYMAKTAVGYGGHFIFNRKTKNAFFSWDLKPILMPPCFGLVDNVLLAICTPDRLLKVVDRNLMSQEVLDKIEQLKEDDNPIIVKYYLKK